MDRIQRIRVMAAILIWSGVVWAALASHGPPAPLPSDVVTARDGTIYVAGVFRDTVDFDPGPGEDRRTAVGGLDVFVSRFTTDGGYLGTQTFGGREDDDSDGLTVDERGVVRLVAHRAP